MQIALQTAAGGAPPRPPPLPLPLPPFAVGLTRGYSLVDHKMQSFLPCLAMRKSRYYSAAGTCADPSSSCSLCAICPTST
eukprot:4983498-Prymnesium_polylepis.1